MFNGLFGIAFAYKCVEMRVGIPVFNNRVSPVFDWAKRLLIVDINDAGERVSERITEIPGYDVYGRVELLVENNIDVLVCAGICITLMQLISDRGINVIPGVIGDVDEVIKALVNGRLEEPRFVMPGFGKFKGRMRGRRGPHRRGMRPGRGRFFWNGNNIV